MFGVPESSFADSPLDYLRLSSHVLGHWITGITEALVSRAFYARLYENYWPLGLGFTGVWLVVVLLWWFVRLRQYVHAKVVAAVQRVRSNAMCRTVWLWLTHRKWSLLILGSIWSWVPMGVWVLGVLMVVVAVFAAAVPLLGHASGGQHLQKLVVEPEVCIPLQGRAQRLAQAQRRRDQALTPSSQQPKPVPGASCVQIRPEEKGEPRQGRLVVATAKWAVLFDPERGSVWRVSVDNAEIVPVASLAAPSMTVRKTLTPVSSTASQPSTSPATPSTTAPGSVVGKAGSP